MTPTNQRRTLQTIYDAVNYLALNPQHQTTGYMARDPAGRPVMPTDETACSWCVLGRIAHDMGLSVPSVALASYDKRPVPNIRLNDQRLTAKLREEVLYPLGLTAHFFMFRNDRADPERRQQGLEEIMATILSHPVLLKGY
jgi:hypothetical protein